MGIHIDLGRYRRADNGLARHQLGLLIRPGQHVGNDVLLEHAAPSVIVDGAARDREADRLLEALLAQFIVHVLFDEFMGRHSGTHSFLAL